MAPGDRPIIVTGVVGELGLTCPECKAEQREWMASNDPAKDVKCKSCGEVYLCWASHTISAHTKSKKPVEFNGNNLHLAEA